MVYSSKTGQMEYIDGGNGSGQIDIVSAKSYFYSLDSEGAFNYRFYKSARHGWELNKTNLLNSIVNWASYALGANILGLLSISDTEIFERKDNDIEEGIPYIYDETKALQKQRNNGNYMVGIDATWGEDNDYFYYKKDRWILQTKKNNMSKWLVGFDITARMYVYMTF